MADIKTMENRSKNMSAIKRANTKPELFIRKLLFANGFRYRIQEKKVPGHPDIWMKKYNTAIFINGCFWHRHNGCSLAYTPKSRIEFWNNKFDNNMRRDRVVQEQLLDLQIKCLIIWECTIKKVQKKNGDPQQLLSEIQDFLLSDDLYCEI